MNLVVRTYPVGVPGTEFVHQIPRGAVYLSSYRAVDYDLMKWRFVMSFLVDQDATPEEKIFRVVPDGEVLNFTPGAHRGYNTVLQLHTFEVIK